MPTQLKPLIFRSKLIVFVVTLPQQRSVVRFYNMESCRRYTKDLREKNIEYKCTFYYEEPERIYQRTL